MNIKKKINDLLEEEADLMSVKNVVDLEVKTHQATDMIEDEINIKKNNRLPVDPLIAVYILQKTKKLLIKFNHPYAFMIKDLGLILLQRRKIKNKRF